MNTSAIDAVISSVGQPPRAVYVWRCPKCGEERVAPWLAAYQPELMCRHDDEGSYMMRIVDEGVGTMDYDI